MKASNTALCERRKMQSFEDYKAQFAGLCTDDMAYELWIISVGVLEPSEEVFKSELLKAKEVLRNGQTC